MSDFPRSELFPQTPTLDATTEACGNCVVVRVRGEIDLSTKAVFQRYLNEGLQSVTPPYPLVVDLRAVTFLSSSGLAALLEANRAAAERGTPLRLVATHRVVSRPVDAAGLSQMLRLHPTLESAVG